MPARPSQGERLLKLIAARPGLTRRDLLISAGGRRTSAAIAEVEALVGSGEAHYEEHEYVDSIGRHVRRTGLFPGPATELFPVSLKAAITPTELRRRRQANGLTKAELARLLRVTQTLIDKWEKGQQLVPTGFRDALEDALARSAKAERKAERQARYLELVVAAIADEPGQPRTRFLRRFGHRTDDYTLTRTALERALADGRIHEERITFSSEAGRGHNQRRVRRGLFVGPAEPSVAPLDQRMSGVEFRALRERLGRSQGSVAKSLGLSPVTVAGWERRCVPPARVPDILALEPAQPPRAEAVRGTILLLLKKQPGATRFDVTRALRPPLMAHGLGIGPGAGLIGDDLHALLDGGKIHERPRADGRLGLFRGRAPREWAPGEPITSTELRDSLAETGLTHKHLADLVGVHGTQVSAWARGNPIPHGRRAQIRRALREAPQRPDVFTGDDLRRMRLEHGWTQHELARRLNVQPLTIVRWEHGVNRVSSARVAEIRLVLTAPPDVEQPHIHERARELRELRARVGWSQRRLAREMGVTQTAVSHWEAGAKPIIGEERLRQARAAVASELAHELAHAARSTEKVPGKRA